MKTIEQLPKHQPSRIKLAIPFLLSLLIGTAGTAAFGEDEVTCITCHDQVASKPVKHMAVEMGCESCHAPVEKDTYLHKDTGYPNHLLGPVNESCLQCHDKNLFKFEKCTDPKNGDNCGHPFAKNPKASSGVGVKTHPFMGSKDPLAPGKPFDCVSCHNPHSSESPKLFKYRLAGQGVPYQGVGIFCIRCHSHMKETSTITQGATCSVCHWEQSFSTPRLGKPLPNGEESILPNPTETLQMLHSKVLKKDLKKVQALLTGEALVKYGTNSGLAELAGQFKGTKFSSGEVKVLSKKFEGDFQSQSIFEVPWMKKSGTGSDGTEVYKATVDCVGVTQVTRAGYNGEKKHTPGTAVLFTDCRVSRLIKI